MTNGEKKFSKYKLAAPKSNASTAAVASSRTYREEMVIMILTPLRETYG
jgi:hypothetical protein